MDNSKKSKWKMKIGKVRMGPKQAMRGQITQFVANLKEKETYTPPQQKSGKVGEICKDSS